MQCGPTVEGLITLFELEREKMSKHTISNTAVSGAGKQLGMPGFGTRPKQHKGPTGIIYHSVRKYNQLFDINIHIKSCYNSGQSGNDTRHTRLA